MMPLYRRLLGNRFDALPQQVRTLHDVCTTATWVGRADVKRGSSLAARVIATLFGLPPAGLDQPLTVTFAPKGDAEIWSRVFGTRQFQSTQSAFGTELRETVGPCTLRMSLQANELGLALTLDGASVLGLSVPNFMLPRIHTLESERDGRYTFDVGATIAPFGLLVHYRGWLVRAAS